MYCKKISFFVLIISVTYVRSGCDLKEADMCGMKGSFFGNRDVMVPTNDQELDQHCTTIRESLKCLQGFTNDCLKGFVQTAIKMATGNADKHLSKRCDIKKDRDEFLTNAKCLTNKDNMEPFHVCAEKNSVMMEKLVDVALEDRIPAGCCIFHSFQDCIRTNMEKICGDTSRDYWDEVINDIAEDSVSYTCSGLESVDKCEKSLNPKVWNDLKEVAAINDAKELAAKHKYSSGFALTIELLKNIGNE